MRGMIIKRDAVKLLLLAREIIAIESVECGVKCFERR